MENISPKSPSIYHQGMDQALHWLSELVTNSSLRLQLRQQALQLAEPYSLEKLSQRLALIFAQVLEENGETNLELWYL